MIFLVLKLLIWLLRFFIIEILFASVPFLIPLPILPSSYSTLASLFCSSHTIFPSVPWIATWSVTWSFDLYTLFLLSSPLPFSTLRLRLVGAFCSLAFSAGPCKSDKNIKGQLPYGAILHGDKLPRGVASPSQSGSPFSHYSCAGASITGDW